MEWNGLWSLVYGLLGGLFEFLPVSPYVHQQVLLKISGLDDPGCGLSFAIHFGALVAVVVSMHSKLSKLNRERKLIRQPRRMRKRQPDVASLMELRLLRIAAVPFALSCLAAPWLKSQFSGLWLLAILAALNGFFVLLPQYLTRANKDARSLSPLDATLVGLGGALGALPGVSHFGMVASVGSMRGMDRSFGLDFAYLLMIPGLIALCVGDLSMLFVSGSTVQGVTFFSGILACIASFGAGYAGMSIMRALVQKDSCEGFACYNWGLAMFAFVFYLIG